MVVPARAVSSRTCRGESQRRFSPSKTAADTRAFAARMTPHAAKARSVAEKKFYATHASRARTRDQVRTRYQKRACTRRHAHNVVACAACEHRDAYATMHAHRVMPAAGTTARARCAASACKDTAAYTLINFPTCARREPRRSLENFTSPRVSCRRAASSADGMLLAPLGMPDLRRGTIVDQGRGRGCGKPPSARGSRPTNAGACVRAQRCAAAADLEREP